tara:strand:- start:11315 stop:11899 length:585 start_codon:yes stop_codon:yes gene_type:complete
MKENNAIKWFWIIILICSIQLVYKFKFEEPYPSLCYPDFAKPDIIKMQYQFRQNKYYSPASKAFDDKFYQHEYLVDDYYTNLYKPRWCSYEFYVYKEGGDSLVINPRLLFQSPLNINMIDRTIKSRFWDFPKLKYLFYKKGVAYLPNELLELETFLSKGVESITHEKDFKYIKVFWTDKKSEKLIKIVRINISY